MALELKRLNGTGAQSGTVDVSDVVFGQEANNQVIFDVLMAQMAARRQGTAKTKARAEVSGGGRKPFKQKGTGNARQGSIRSPNYPGGGKVFGPIPRSYDQDLPKKLKPKAIQSVLSGKAAQGSVFVFDKIAFDKPSTKTVVGFLTKAQLKKGIFVDLDNENLKLSVKNMPSVAYCDVRTLNVFDLLKFENVILSEASLKVLEERLSK